MKLISTLSFPSTQESNHVSSLPNQLEVFSVKSRLHCKHRHTNQNGWLVVLRIKVDLAIFQPYHDLESGDNKYLKIQVARPGIEPRSSCSAIQELKGT